MLLFALSIPPRSLKSSCKNSSMCVVVLLWMHMLSSEWKKVCAYEKVYVCKKVNNLTCLIVRWGWLLLHVHLPMQCWLWNKDLLVSADIFWQDSFQSSTSDSLSQSSELCSTVGVPIDVYSIHSKSPILFWLTPAQLFHCSALSSSHGVGRKQGGTKWVKWLFIYNS